MEYNSPSPLLAIVAMPFIPFPASTMFRAFTSMMIVPAFARWLWKFEVLLVFTYTERRYRSSHQHVNYPNLRCLHVIVVVIVVVTIVIVVRQVLVNPNRNPAKSFENLEFS